MWYDDRPPPSESAKARAKVFELARIPLGMMHPEEADDWRDWLDAVEHGTPFVPQQHAGPRRCSACGTLGHKRTTCPVARPELEGRERCVVERASVLMCSRCLIRPAVRRHEDGVVPPACDECRLREWTP